MRRLLIGAVALVAVSCADPLAPSIDDGALPEGRVGVRYSATLTGDHVHDWSAYSTPPGLSLSDRGVLSGTPTLAGTFTFTVRGTSVLTDPPRTVSHGYVLVVTR